MKNVMVKYLCFLLINIVVSINSKAQTQQCPQLTAEINQIEYGDLSTKNNIYCYDSIDLNRGLVNFYKYFKYRPNLFEEIFVELERDTAKLSIQQLEFLLNECKKINYTLENSIAAIRMFFGIENQKMIILFEPICLQKVINTDGTFKIDTFSERVFYRMQNNNLQLSPNYNELIEAYQSPDFGKSKIYIKHLRRSTRYTTLFIKNDNPYIGDTKSCILPIQQIEKMYCDNYPNWGGKINFSVVANNNYDFLRGPNLRRKNMKLHVIAYLDSVTTNNTIDSFKNLGADFGQMDPPRIESVYYPLK